MGFFHILPAGIALLYRCEGRVSYITLHSTNLAFDRSVLNGLAPDTVETQPELLAHHYSSGFTNLSSIAHSDLGCWAYEKAKPSTPRPEH